MARLTDEEKTNLSNNLKRLIKTPEQKKNFCLKTEIKERTLESYIYLEKGASPKSLDEMADYFNLTPEILIAPNMIKKETELRNELRNYIPIYENKKRTYNEQIMDILYFHDTIGKQIVSFLNLVESADFDISFYPTYTPDEYDAFTLSTKECNHSTFLVRKQHFDNKIKSDILTNNKIYVAKDTDKISKLQSIFQSPEYDQLKEVLKNSQNGLIDKRLLQEMFLEAYKMGQYTEASSDELPLGIYITQNQTKPDIRKLEDLYSMRTFEMDFSLQKMYEITRLFLSEPFDAEDFYEYIYNLEE